MSGTSRAKLMYVLTHFAPPGTRLSWQRTKILINQRFLKSRSKEPKVTGETPGKTETVAGKPEDLLYITNTLHELAVTGLLPRGSPRNEPTMRGARPFPYPRLRPVTQLLARDRFILFTAPYSTFREKRHAFYLGFQA